MKLLRLGILSTSLALSPVVFAVGDLPWLWPAYICAEPVGGACFDDELWAYDHLERCGCVRKADYVDPATCQVTPPKCHAGTLLSQLFYRREHIGCGCFANRF